VRDIYIRAAATYGASYVDLYDSVVTEKLKEDPDKYYADDLLHLSDDGYELWYDEIEKKL